MTGRAMYTVVRNGAQEIRDLKPNFSLEFGLKSFILEFSN